MPDLLKARVLVVSARNATLDELARIIEAMPNGHTVVKVDSQLAAMELLKGGPANKIMVVHHTGGPTIEFLERLQTECPFVAVVLVVNPGDYEIVVAAINRGAIARGPLAYRVLATPLDTAEVVKRIDEAVERAENLCGAG